MAYTNIDDPTIYFNTLLYSGNAADGSSTTQDISGVGFQPDWIWLKGRNNANNHVVDDSVRGANKHLFPDLTNAENTSTEYIKSFASDGFQLGGDGAVNGNGNTYVAWNWKAGGSGSANTDGDVTSTVSANTTAGFSIVSYSGSSNSTFTVGHGLGAVPKMFVLKKRSASGTNWVVYHASLGNDKRVQWNNTDASASTTGYGSTDPTSSVFTVANGSTTGADGQTYIAYCFAEKQGYSKFGSFTGNGNADGVFVYLGFRPAFIVIKKSSGTENWSMYDTKRNKNDNEDTLPLNIDNSDVESGNTGKEMDILSNGIKMRTSNGELNASSTTYIYWAFAENPFVNSRGVPGNAK